MGISNRLLEIARSKHYWLYIGNELKNIANFFDTGFACDDILYNHAYNVLDVRKI